MPKRADSANGVVVIKCNSWEEFFLRARNREAGRVVGPHLYRGQANPDWKLSSKFERTLMKWKKVDNLKNVRKIYGPNKGYEAIRDGYLHRFKQSAIGTPGLKSEGLKEEDWWMVGRHQGLVTPLLDWTLSPYIAAFFAYSDYVETSYSGFSKGIPEGFIPFEAKPVVVWALAPFSKLEKEGEFEIISGRNAQSYRQKAQQGVFTRLTHDTLIDLESYLVSRKLGHYLEKIEIPSLEWGKALNDLMLMNISYDTIFPDLYGAAMQANLAPLIVQYGMSGTVVEIRLP